MSKLIRAKKFAQAHQNKLHFAKPRPAVLTVLPFNRELTRMDANFFISVY